VWEDAAADPWGKVWVTLSSKDGLHPSKERLVVIFTVATEITGMTTGELESKRGDMAAHLYSLAYLNAVQTGCDHMHLVGTNPTTEKDGRVFQTGLFTMYRSKGGPRGPGPRQQRRR
jgi:hypothetical protein